MIYLHIKVVFLLDLRPVAPPTVPVGTVHGRGVLFPEAGLNLTAYHVVLLQGLQLETTAHWRFAP